MSAEHHSEPAGVPRGRYVTLPGRGELLVREHTGPDKAPTLVLLHGWVGTGGSNFYAAFPCLTDSFSLVVPDLRGHGRGIRGHGRFNLADCADDVAALLEVLDLHDAVLVGFSMGGPVAQLTWQRARARVAGLVLGATAYRFVTSNVVRLAVTMVVPAIAQASRVSEIAARIPLPGLRRLLPPSLSTERSVAAWAAKEVRRHDIRQVIEAGLAMGTYDAGNWIGEIDVPTGVVVSTKDRAVDVAAQLRMALRIPQARVFPVADGHLGVLRPEFCDALAAACRDVATRAGLLDLRPRE
jgi:pimeloyl-ACP methyl ester carboxylesterase